MLNVSEEVKDLYLTDNTPVEIKLVIDEDIYSSRNIVASSVSITESMCSLETFTLSAVEKNELTFSLFNEDQTIKDLVGKTVTATHVVTLEDESIENVPLGTYTIVDAVKDGDYVVQCTCYDNMLAFDKIIDDWWNNHVQFPISIRNLVISLFTEVGVQYTLPETFTNENFVITDKPTFFENVAASEVLSYIQEVVGGFFKVDRLGIVRLLNARKLGAFGLVPKIGLYPKEGLYPAASDVVGFGENAEIQDYAYRHIFGDLTVAEYAVNKISALQIRGTENDVGVVVGSGTDAYIIEGNPLLFNITDSTGREVAENLFAILKELVYVPFSGEFKALPFLEVGDCVYVVTYIGNVVKSPILHRVMSSTKLSVDSFVTKGTKHRQIKRTVNRMLSTINQKTHEMINTVDELSSTISNVEQRVTTNTTQIQQNATAINLSATRSGTFNLLTNSDFSDQNDRLTGWQKLITVTNTEYTYDEEFKDNSYDYNKIENGHCLKLTLNPSASPSMNYAYIWQEINYNGAVLEAIQTQFSGRVLTWDGDARFTMALRIWDDTGTSIYFRNGSFISTNVVERHLDFNFRNKWADILTYTEGKTISKIGVYVYVNNMSGENIIEVNHIFATFNSGDSLPWYSWTNYASKDLISQINIAPSGVKIQGEKIDIWGVTTIHNTDGTGETVLTGSTIRSATIETGVLKGVDSSLTFDMSTSNAEYKIKTQPNTIVIDNTTYRGLTFTDENWNGAIGLTANLITLKAKSVQFAATPTKSEMHYTFSINDTTGVSLFEWKYSGTGYTPYTLLSIGSSYTSLYSPNESSYITLSSDGFSVKTKRVSTNSLEGYGAKWISITDGGGNDHLVLAAY